MRYVVLLIGGVLLIFSLVGCGLREDAKSVVTPTPAVLSQWAMEAQASSAYGRPDWSPMRATGAPEIATCSDDPRAWASARGDGLAWLELSYAQPVYATEVRIYQTLGRGAITRVRLLGEGGTDLIAWEGTDANGVCPGVLSVSVSRTDFPVVAVRVDLDESRTGFWNQIDAVELIGIQL